LKGLSRRKLPDTHFVNKAKERLLLDLPRMNRDLGNLEAWIPRDTYRAQLCGIEPGFHFIQGKRYRLTDGCFGRPAETVTRIRTYQPHIVPPSVSDPQIKCGGSDISGRRPYIVKLLLHEVEAIGQQAACAQEYRMLFTLPVFWLPMCPLNGQDRSEIWLQPPIALWKNALGHQPDETLVPLPSLRGTRLPNGRWYLADVLARKETQFSFAAQKDSLVHQLF
jgi:hypothetical protein